MVNNNSDQLTTVFSALADPTRRAILMQLAEASRTPGELQMPKKISKPALSKHLRILEHSGLLSRSIRGRNHRLFLQPNPLHAAADWIEHYQRFWEGQLDSLDQFLQQEVKQEAGESEDSEAES